MNDNAQNQKCESLEKAKFLWDEYRYRHELCWKLLFQITTAVVVLLSIPFVRPDIALALGKPILFLPGIAIALSLLSVLRVYGELKILDKIRCKHREFHSSLFQINYGDSGSYFTLQVILYLCGLAFVSIIDLVIVWKKWP